MPEELTRPAIHIGLLNYPGAMQSALHGMTEMFFFADRICAEHAQAQLPRFVTSRYLLQDDTVVLDSASAAQTTEPLSRLHVLVVPPSVGNLYYRQPSASLLDWLKHVHASGTLICSACAGTFILAAAGLLEQRRATTHWNLAVDFQHCFPQVRLDTDRILINDGDIITAGGLMSWLDLGLELVEQFTRPAIVLELGKWLILDTGNREQRFYKKFIPVFDHGNALVIKAQRFIQKTYMKPVTIRELAAECCVTERTLLRNFASATGYTPLAYIQQVRIQSARELIETTTLRIEQVALRVGYEDSSAFRKIFKKLTGLTPGEYRSRFVA